MVEEPINVTDAAFDRAVLQADRPVVAVFWSRKDGDAERLREVAEATARGYAGEVRVARLEADDTPQAHARYEVEPLPQFLFFRDGRLVARARGLPTEETLRPWVEYLLGRGPQMPRAAHKLSPPPRLGVLSPSRTPTLSRWCSGRANRHWWTFGPSGAARAGWSPRWWSGWRRSSQDVPWWPSWTWTPTATPRSSTG